MIRGQLDTKSNITGKTETMAMSQSQHCTTVVFLSRYWQPIHSYLGWSFALWLSWCVPTWPWNYQPVSRLHHSQIQNVGIFATKRYEWTTGFDVHWKVLLMFWHVHVWFLCVKAWHQRATLALVAETIGGTGYQSFILRSNALSPTVRMLGRNARWNLAGSAAKSWCADPRPFKVCPDVELISLAPQWPQRLRTGKNR